MLNARLIVGVYATLGAAGALAAMFLDLDPMWREPIGPGALLSLLPLLSPDDPWMNAGISVALGLGLAAIGIASAKILVARFAWARALHAELAPVVRGTSDRDVIVVALASGIAEELLFRGLLSQVMGVVLSSIVFGVLHQVRGPARWAWMGWATAMGLLLGGIFAWTGSLLGPIVAHVVTNAVNLRFVRDHGAPPSPRLGSLLLR